MTPQEYRERYAGLTNAQVRELIKTDAAFRQETEALYTATFRAQLNKSCSECWMDAYVLLMKSDITKIMEKAKTSFELRAGALLVDVVNGDNAKLATRHNLTDELALYHLSTNPSYRPLFSKVPEDLDERLLEYVNRQAAGATAPKKAAEAPSNGVEAPKSAEADKEPVEGAKAPENGPKSPEELLAEAEANYKKARTTAKGAATKLQNLEGAEEKDEKKIAFARESKEKAVAALVEAAIAYRDAADAAGVTVDVEEAPKKAAEEPEKPAEEPAKPADEPEKSDEGAEE